jgi:hypothetical protein
MKRLFCILILSLSLFICIYIYTSIHVYVCVCVCLFLWVCRFCIIVRGMTIKNLKLISGVLYCQLSKIVCVHSHHKVCKVTYVTPSVCFVYETAEGISMKFYIGDVQDMLQG